MSRISGFLVFFLASSPSFAQVGMPGVSYNGGKTEKEICERADETRPNCATYLTSVANSYYAFMEKRRFAHNCQSFFRLIQNENAKIERTEKECASHNQEVAAFLAKSAQGASNEAIDEAKKINEDVGKS